MAFQEHRNYVDFDDMEADILEIVHESGTTVFFVLLVRSWKKNI